VPTALEVYSNGKGGTVLFFACYLQCEERKNVRSKNYRLGAELMECVAFLSQSGRLINSMADYYDKQIKEVEKKIAEKNIS